MDILLFSTSKILSVQVKKYRLQKYKKGPSKKQENPLDLSGVGEIQDFERLSGEW